MKEEVTITISINGFVPEEDYHLALAKFILTEIVSGIDPSELKPNESGIVKVEKSWVKGTVYEP
jgi:hypothetical protein